MRHLFAAIAVAGALILAQTASAADRKVNIVNKTGETLTEFYASVQSTNDWEEDILGDDTVDDGDTFEANIDDGSGKCVYDFKGVFENGGEVIKKGVNVCKVGTFTFTR